MRIKGLVGYLLLMAEVQAGTFTGPTAGFKTRYDQDGFPFDNRGAHVQEVFPKEAFANLPSDIVEITAIGFHGVWQQIDVRDLQIQMGTQLGNRALSDFSSSYATLDGPPAEVFPKANFQISASSQAAVIPLPNPFFYDRRAGNLFMDLRCTTSLPGGAQQVDWAYNDGSGPTYYTLLQTFPDLNYPPTFANGALVIDLHFTSVPEPSVFGFTLIGVGLLAIGMKLKGSPALGQRAAGVCNGTSAAYYSTLK